MKILFNFINLNKNYADFVDISEYVYRTCTLALSHRLVAPVIFILSFYCIYFPIILKLTHYVAIKEKK